MKKAIVILMVLALLLCTVPAMASTMCPWGDYVLELTNVVTDPSKISFDVVDGEQPISVVIKPVGGTIKTADLETLIPQVIFRDADRNEYEVSRWSVTGCSLVGGKFTMNEEQDSVMLFFSIPGADASIINGAKILIPGDKDGHKMLLAVDEVIPANDTESAAEEPAAEEPAAGIPEAVVGTWHGTGTPKNGGPSIDLTISLSADGTGEYTFVQRGYTETAAITLKSTDNTFVVEDTAVGSCSGTWALDDNGSLLLDITSVLASGAEYSYTAVCEKEAAAAEEEAETAAELPDENPSEDEKKNDVATEEIPDETEAAAEETSNETAAEETSGIEAVLDALDNDAYRTAYEAMLGGETVAKGSKGDTAKAVQSVLVAFGQDITADGDAGKKTISALNAVQEAFGLDVTDSVDADTFAQLLRYLLIKNDPDTAESVLTDMDSDVITYVRACALYLGGSYYEARQLFQESGMGDSYERAEACLQSYPKTGQVWKSKSVKGSGMHLTIKVQDGGDTVRYYKVYNEDNEPVAALFINGTGKATTKLPGGTYRILSGTGTEWYGVQDAFGRDGYYQMLTFDSNGGESVKLKSGYTYTITINTSSTKGDSVGSEYTDYDTFTSGGM